MQEERSTPFTENDIYKESTACAPDNYTLDLPKFAAARAKHKPGTMADLDNQTPNNSSKVQPLKTPEPFHGDTLKWTGGQKVVWNPKVNTASIGYGRMHSDHLKTLSQPAPTEAEVQAKYWDDVHEYDQVGVAKHVEIKHDYLAYAGAGRIFGVDHDLEKSEKLAEREKIEADHDRLHDRFGEEFAIDYQVEYEESDYPPTKKYIPQATRFT